MKEKKENLREEMKRKLDALGAGELAAKNAALEQRFLKSPEFNAAGSLLVYVSLPTEPETRVIIRKALEMKKKVYAPKVEGNFVCVCEVQGLERLKPGRFGIHEPPGEAKCELREFDLAVIPGLAFDKEGNRLGRGGGFYDRLLSSAKAEFVAFVFDEQLVDKVPVQEHDVRVHKIFTDKRVIECQ